MPIDEEDEREFNHDSDFTIALKLHAVTKKHAYTDKEQPLGKEMEALVVRGQGKAPGIIGPPPVSNPRESIKSVVIASACQVEGTPDDNGVSCQVEGAMRRDIIKKRAHTDNERPV